eukprot:6672046-Heterocapsa_arctica.AAC.1
MVVWWGDVACRFVVMMLPDRWWCGGEMLPAVLFTLSHCIASGCIGTAPPGLQTPTAPRPKCDMCLSGLRLFH